MSKKSEKVEKFSKKKLFFPSQNLVIWSGNSAEFPGPEAKKRKKKFFFRFCTGPHWPGPLRGAHDVAISGWGSAKMSQKCEKIEKFSEKKSFLRSQNLVIWSGISAEFPGLEEKKCKKSFFSDFVLCPIGQAL